MIIVIKKVVLVNVINIRIKFLYNMFNAYVLNWKFTKLVLKMRSRGTEKWSGKRSGTNDS